MKITKSTASAALILLVLFMVLPATANEVNSTATGLILNGGLSTGSTMFGVVSNTSSSSDLGTGSGNGIHLGILLNYQILTLGLNYSTVSFANLEWEEEISGVKYEFKSEGDGRYWTFDLLFGAKMFTEAGDMGFTQPYIGYRFWKATRNAEDVTRNGIPYPAGNVKWELDGRGWIFGIRDFSTLPLGAFSIALQSGIWYYNAPMATLKSNENEMQTQSEENVGFGFELGAGIAIEDIGLSVIGGIKIDLQATAFKVSAFDFVAGSGYAQFFLAATYELSI